MRALQKTAISYGLHNIPVKICTMIRDNETSLSNACPKCQGDIGYKNYCKSCGNEPAWADMLKAFKLTVDQKYVFTKEQLDQLKEVTERSIQILGTIPRSNLDVRLVNSGYYILPDKLTKAWEILRRAILQSDKAIIVNFAIRGKQRLGVLIARDDAIIMLGIAFGDQLVKLDEEIKVTLSDSEANLGKGFLQILPEIDLSQVKDSFKEKLEKLITGQPVQITSKPVKSETAFFEEVVQTKLV